VVPLPAKASYSRAMNIQDPKAGRLARLHYGDGEYAVLSPGTHVICAVTGAEIPLDRLRYWNVDLQEAYVDAQAAAKRHAQLKAEGRI